MDNGDCQTFCEIMIYLLLHRVLLWCNNFAEKPYLNAYLRSELTWPSEIDLSLDEAYYGHTENQHSIFGCVLLHCVSRKTTLM